MKRLVIALVLGLVLSAARGANAVDDIYGSAANNLLLDNASRNWQSAVYYTTDGNGNVRTLNGATLVSDVVAGISGTNYLKDNAGRIWQANVCYTTDGTGNVIPVMGPSGGTGTVTSVGLLLPSSVFSLSGTPVTTSGTLTGAFQTQAAHQAFMGPVGGSPATPGFRAFAASDIPNLPASIITSGQGSLTTSTTGVTVTGTNACLLNETVDVQTASGSQPGLLSAADWTTFNGKQAGPLTGDATTSGSVITFATVNSNVGSFTNASFTVNGKGLVTAASSGPAPVTTIGAIDGNTASANGLSISSNTLYAQSASSSNPGMVNTGTQTFAGTKTFSTPLALASLSSLQVNQNLFVDGHRTDTYTADGSPERPFKTIGAAVTQVISNGDNATKQYTINITPGSYAETITLNSASLDSLIFTSTTGTGQTATQSTTVNGITSTSNNTQLATLLFNNITVNGALNLTGDTNGTNFCSSQCVFIGSQFNNGSSTITLNNVNNVSFYGGQIQGSGSVATFTNVAFAYMYGAEGFIGGTTLHLVQNNGGNQPSQSSGNYFLMSQTKFYGTMTIDAGSELDTLQTYFGSTSAVTNSGTLHDWGTNWGSSTALVLNSGSTWRNRGDVLWLAPTGTGTIQNQDIPFMASGVFGTSANAVTNAVVVMKDGHLQSGQTTVPTATVNANAGTGATCTVAHATDTAGMITLVTGSVGTPATGDQCRVNFNKAYNVAPICTLTPANATAGLDLVQVYVDQASVTGSIMPFAFGTAGTTTATYVYNYQCLETQ